MGQDPDPGGHCSTPAPADVSDQETLERGSADLEALPTVARPLSTRTSSSGGQGPALEPGCRFGAYRTVRLLGAGGFGQVWEAESLATGRRLALKVLTAAATASSEEIERFKREGRLAASLSHPHCVYVLGAEEIQGFPVITMELMSGGTLADKLRDEGPFPYRQAVDFALQLAEGLEAASRAGVIHRDVKPSNCFLDGTGAVRVGDFGLSKTLEVDAHLTATGSFLGTPSYSSPEQVRGRDVDLRSDLYSLGATLYALLTGRPPFVGHGTEVLARILSEPPEPFSGRDASVPRGLRQIVGRLLAKDKGRRHASYAALRDALLPYSSRGLAPGDVGRRLAAILADVSLFSLATALIGGSRLLFQPTAWQQMAQNVLLVAYFALLEGRWGQSLGKRLFGLRVVTSSAGPSSPVAVLARSGLFVSILFLPSTVGLVWLSPEGFLAMAARSPGPFLVATLLAPMALLVSTMRRRNGYAALHELLTRTRVMAVRAAASRPTLAVVRDADVTATENPRRFGPYRELHPIWDSRHESLLLARDDELRRNVWIHLYADESRGAREDALAIRRPGRLHWLQGSRSGADSWDAYEAPSGIGLRQRVRSSGPLPWAELRHVLLDVVGALADGAEDRGEASLRLSRVWLSAEGRATLLDFSPTGEDTAGAPGWRTFAHQILLYGLEADEALPPAGRLPKVPLPEHARPLIERICGVGERLPTPAGLRDALETVARRATSVSRVRRLGPLALVTFLAASHVAMVAPAYLSTGPLATANRTILQSRVGLDRLTRIADESERRSMRAEIRALQAHSYATLLSFASADRPAPSSFLETIAVDASQSMARAFLSTLLPEERETLEAARHEHPSPSAEEIAAARRRVDALVPPPRFRDRIPRIVLSALLPGAILGLLLAPILRGAPLLALFGMAVQTSGGGRIGRLHSLLRAATTWAPFVLFHLWRPWPHLSLLLLVAVAGAASVALARPDRGLVDLVVGTRVVRR